MVILAPESMVNILSATQSRDHFPLRRIQDDSMKAAAFG